jgi:hypothetical protein
LVAWHVPRRYLIKVPTSDSPASTAQLASHNDWTRQGRKRPGKGWSQAASQGSP